MGNRYSENCDHDSRRRENRGGYSSESEEEQRSRRYSRRREKSSSRRRGSSGRRSRRDEGPRERSYVRPRERVRNGEINDSWERGEPKDPFDNVTDIMQFGHGLMFGPSFQERFGFGFGEDFERMMKEASHSGGTGGPYRSAQMFSSITTIGNDGVPVSESRGVSTNSSGRYKMAHQRRIGDRSQTLMRQRKHEAEEFQDSQRLHQITHDELPKFHTEFRDRTKDWSSFQRLKSSEKPSYRAIEDGRRPKSPDVTINRRRSSYDKYRPRGVEY